MYTSLGPFVVWFTILAVCAFAYFKGDRPERWGAVTVLGGSIYALLIHLLMPEELRPTLLLLGEGVMGVVYLMLAMRYPSAWLGVVVLLQAIQCSLHAYYLVGERKRDLTYAVINNIDTLGILACLTLGAVLAWRRRIRAEK
ncbi:MAG: hypothetical protein ACOVMT_00375 [Caulobacter sp.]